MLVIDAHCDAPSQMQRLRNYSQDNERGQVDFPKLKRGGVDASFFALYIPSALGTGEAAFSHACRLLEALESQVPCSDACFARCAGDVLAAKSEGRFAVMTALENGSPIGDDLSRVEWFAGRGVKYITLTHSADNQLCDSCSGQGSWSRGAAKGGLSPFGREVVKEMNRLGVLVDLAHCSHATVRDVLECSEKPVVDTHTACSALCGHPRNLPDNLMADIAAAGGVVGISIYPCFISEEFNAVLDASGLEKKSWVEDEFIADPGNEEKASAWWSLVDELAGLPRPGIARVVDHIEHAVEVCGVGHVGIGTDYDGIAITPEGLETVASFSALWSEMRRRGFSEEQISAIAGENLLRMV